MTAPNISVGSRKRNRLAQISLILPIIAGMMLFTLLVYLGVIVNFEIYQSQGGETFTVINDYTCIEVEKEDAPIGIVKEYTFTIDENLKNDTSLAFYTVHQYVGIYIDGKLVYSMKPSGIPFIKTIGSNWTMIPLYREDAGKEICVDIIPVYESFRNREIEFLVGSRLSIYLDRLYQDAPQIILSIMAIFIGILFICIAVYKLIHKRSDDGIANLGLFSIMLGLWRLTDTRFTPFLFSEKPVLMFYISVTVLMIGVVPLIKAMETRFHKVSRCILDCYSVAVAVICIVQIVVQIFFHSDFRENMLITHLMIGVGSIVLVGNVIYERIKYPQIQKGVVSLKASFILVMGALGDIIAFYVRGTSSGLLFSLLAMLIYIIITGVNMMFLYVEQEKAFTESRISTMMSQIRPHFIYNTLGSIEQLCELHPETAAKLVHNFAHYLRGNFSELDNTAPIRLSQEIDHTKYYVNIEQIRFPDIEVIFDLRSDDFLLPALSVQPLVENAIKHGLMKLEKGGTVIVYSFETETHYFVSVEDNGAGFDTSVLLDEKKHIGLRNIRGRLESMLDGTLTVDSTPGVGTKVTISIPKGVKI